MKIPLTRKRKSVKDEPVADPSPRYYRQLQLWAGEGQLIELISPEDLVKVAGGTIQQAEHVLALYLKKNPPVVDEVQEQQTVDKGEKPFSDSLFDSIMASATQQLKQALSTELERAQEAATVRLSESTLDFQKQIEDCHVTIDGLSERNEALLAQVTDLDQQVTSLRSCLSKESEKAQQSDVKGQQAHNKLIELQANVEQLEQQSEDQKQQHIQQFKFVSEQHQKQITALQTEYQKLKKIQQQSFESKLATKEADLQNLSAKIAGLEATLASSNEALMKATRRAEAAESELEVAQIKIIAASETKYREMDLT